ncbi:hypothetical protein B0H63DRAFT_518603 [Podospora didyma]|uniref:Uncharacterized protein n=1 Tax=Podospora didyma TaxID=330526 RepID=A0AAE0NXR2_9PEZI|nr:hypothetical protein B0H63DRAFT_518603 [Podospora didyma]
MESKDTSQPKPMNTPAPTISSRADACVDLFKKCLGKYKSSAEWYPRIMTSAQTFWGWCECVQARAPAHVEASLDARLSFPNHEQTRRCILGALHVLQAQLEGELSAPLANPTAVFTFGNVESLLEQLSTSVQALEPRPLWPIVQPEKEEKSKGKGKALPAPAPAHHSDPRGAPLYFQAKRCRDLLFEMFEHCFPFREPFRSVVQSREKKFDNWVAYVVSVGVLAPLQASRDPRLAPTPQDSLRTRIQGVLTDLESILEHRCQFMRQPDWPRRPDAPWVTSVKQGSWNLDGRDFAADMRWHVDPIINELCKIAGNISRSSSTPEQHEAGPSRHIAPVVSSNPQDNPFWKQVSRQPG